MQTYNNIVIAIGQLHALWVRTEEYGLCEASYQPTSPDEKSLHWRREKDDLKIADVEWNSFILEQ